MPQSAGRDKEERIPHVLAHNSADNVAVVVIEGLSAGTTAFGVITETDAPFDVQVKQDIPIGHKVALKDLKAGDTAIKYGQDVGRIVKDVAKGEHVHIHNLKTKRW
ncbi:SAF domain protein [Rhodomicrobium vannielii ATCC 17100]|uniref:SAF domain protein n=1 Tax=Rhodomicrobium vannielii (strain ATCC 17100 / DSM 162 / LMG 4299 / NCIMB 10020 / ATH 3.1.1) TaxID=648757 RepID=E3I4S8_RHOVT|nr:UxaA family hydrolase [Rhodomicrobium vannielii]ADP72750.1 SAF domain protein [Rhodomicrobium vannielii ATCC 17100]